MESSMWSHVTEVEHGQPDTLPCGLCAFFVRDGEGAALGLGTPYGTIAILLALDEVRGMARWTPDDAADWRWTPPFIAASYALMGMVAVSVARSQPGAILHTDMIGVTGRPLQMPDALALGAIAARFLATLDASEVRA